MLVLFPLIKLWPRCSFSHRFFFLSISTFSSLSETFKTPERPVPKSLALNKHPGETENSLSLGEGNRRVREVWKWAPIFHQVVVQCRQVLKHPLGSPLSNGDPGLMKRGFSTLRALPYFILRPPCQVGLHHHHHLRLREGKGFARSPELGNGRAGIQTRASLTPQPGF